MNPDLQKKICGVFRQYLLMSLSLCVLTFTLITSFYAERLTIQKYTAANGLPDNSVYKILQDSRGFFWMATFDGMARFDGYEFTNFSLPQGLPSRRINDLIQAKDGTFWLATQSGVVHFNPYGNPHERIINAAEASNMSAPPMFITYLPEGDERTRSIANIFQDSFNNIWVGTLRGLFQLDTSTDSPQFKSVEIGLPTEMDDRRNINFICEDRFHALWIATPSGLFRRWPDGEVQRFNDPANFSEANSYRTVYQDIQGRIWIGTSFEGLLELEIDESRNQPRLRQQFKEKDGLISSWINDILEISPQEIWLATDTGLVSFKPLESAQERFRVFTRTSGIGFPYINCLYKDSGGGLWIGSKSNGVSKISPDVWTVFDYKDGIESIRSIFKQNNDKLGIVAFVTNTELDAQGTQAKTLDTKFSPFLWHLGSYDGKQFTWIKPDLPADISDFGWGDKQLSFQASNGEWWIATAKGLFRFPPAENITDLARLKPKAVYNSKNGLVPDGIIRLYEDSRGDLWISTDAKASHVLYRWERATENLQALSKTNDFPLREDRIFTAFREDSSGNIWIGLSQTSLLRFQNGKFRLFTETDGVPKGWVKDLMLDKNGHLWIASTIGGAARIDDPNAEQPKFTAFNKSNGLSSDNISCLVEDKAGFIYLATDKGIDQLAPETGKIKTFTTSQGVPRAEFRTAFADNEGTLWFGMAQGLLKYTPQANLSVKPPDIWLTALDIEGKAQKISAIGAEEITLPDLSSGQNQIRVNFTSLSASADDSLRYQYKFEPQEDWSVPIKERFINFANLSAGDYKILIRAVASDGTVSEKNAVVKFKVLSPIWQRWWFITLFVGLIALVIYVYYRSRFSRLLEMEQMRTRIATDLHDDIGANLTRISLLSEVAKQNSNNGNGNLLTSIADIARESVSSMSDIVWAISPDHDRLIDLTRKMRQHAEEIFAMRDIELDFNAPVTDKDIQLSVTVRRDLLLIFKEAINNAARHSGCRKVEINFNVVNSILSLRISDDGKGFNIDAESDGQGIRSLTRRSAALGGKIKIDSRPGNGTVIEFVLKLAKAVRLQKL